MLLLPAPMALRLLPAPIDDEHWKKYWAEVESEIRFFESMEVEDMLADDDDAE